MVKKMNRTVIKLTSVKVACKGLLMIAVPLILLLAFVGLGVNVKRQSESAQVLVLQSAEVHGVAQSLLANTAEAEITSGGKF